MADFHVAVILDMARPFDRKILGGMAGYFKQAGNWSMYLEEDPQQRLPDLRVWRGDGIIANLDDRKVALAVQGLHMPAVGVGGGYGWYDPAGQIPYVSSNNQAISRMALQHLLDQGYRRLAFCGFPRTRINRWSEERAIAFRQLAAEAGCPCSFHTGRYETARKWQELQRGLVEWLRSLQRPVGLMACNDLRARHVLEACRTLGVRVPEDIAVIGVDNDEMLCDLTDPPLSSVQQGVNRVGYHAAALLDQLIRGEKPAQTRFFIEPDGVVPRRSTDALAIDDGEVALAARHIRGNACRAIRVDEVARAAGLSRSGIERRFKSVMGRTLRAEIERVRLDAVRRLLRETDLPLKQVAAQAGFGSVQYMTTVFRQRWRQTPGEYRREARPK